MSIDETRNLAFVNWIDNIISEGDLNKASESMKTSVFDPVYLRRSLFDLLGLFRNNNKMQVNTDLSVVCLHVLKVGTNHKRLGLTKDLTGEKLMEVVKKHFLDS